MMNTLYTFGCSFTENFDPFIKYSGTTRYDYIMKYHNGKIPKSWPQIMSEQLNMELRNHGGMDGITGKTGMEGNCNFSIFNNVCMASKDFQRGDIVIIEWTHMERFKWADHDTNRITTITPNQIPIEYDKNVIESIFVNRTHVLWIEELFKYQILINKLADSIGLRVYYWTVDKKIIEYKVKDSLNNNVIGSYKDIVSNLNKSLSNSDLSYALVNIKLGREKTKKWATLLLGVGVGFLIFH